MLPPPERSRTVVRGEALPCLAEALPCVRAALAVRGGERKPDDPRNCEIWTVVGRVFNPRDNGDFVSLIVERRDGTLDDDDFAQPLLRNVRPLLNAKHID